MKIQTIKYRFTLIRYLLAGLLLTGICPLRIYADDCLKDAIVYEDLNKKYLLGLRASVLEDYVLSDFQWYFAETGEAFEGQANSTLVLAKNGRYDGTLFQLSFRVSDHEGNTIHERVYTCPTSIAECMEKAEYPRPSFSETSSLVPTGIAYTEGRIFVNTEHEATAYWFDIQGHSVGDPAGVTIPSGGKIIDIPNAGSCLLLRVQNSEGKRSFKIFQNR